MIHFKKFGAFVHSVPISRLSNRIMRLMMRKVMIRKATMKEVIMMMKLEVLMIVMKITLALMNHTKSIQVIVVSHRHHLILADAGPPY